MRVNKRYADFLDLLGDGSIQTWALEEARRRLEAEGILPDPDSVEGSKD